MTRGPTTAASILTGHDPIGILSPTIRRIPFIETMLGRPTAKPRLGKFPETVCAIAGWGHKSTSIAAQKYAQVHQLPYVAIEDGFLRSVGVGKKFAPKSIVLDDLGIYYNASQPSRLEALAMHELSAHEARRAGLLIQRWRDARVSKYNHLREISGPLPANYVLVADQTFGDASVTLGHADAQAFAQMITAARQQYPECTILVKVHPEVMAGTKKGYLDLAALRARQGIQIIVEDVHPVRLIEGARAIYTVTSQIGFEGLLWGRPVHTFGVPFYAGWGLTQDHLATPSRRRAITIEQLAHAALVEYARYIHPETGEPCQPEDLIDWMAYQRTMRNRYAPTIYALNFSWNKKPTLRKFLQGSAVHFVHSLASVPPESTVAVWGSAALARSDVKVIRVEDGFVRSVGLGADLIRPASWVTDASGIYYDASRPSDLEKILLDFQPDASLIQRAIALRQRIIELGLSKYNLGGGDWSRPTATPGGDRHRTVILVPGQVESDASIQMGTTDIRKNIDLLRAVREANPSAYILYKPHPDVVARLRAEGANENHAADYCDEIVTNTAIHRLLNAVDEVHVMTSLTGFEALIRHRKVVTYGQPFYAGWGLTTDRTPHPRRTRTLTLDELVAGALIMYPTYQCKGLVGFCSPEKALEALYLEQGETRAFGTLRSGLRRSIALATSRRI